MVEIPSVRNGAQAGEKWRKNFLLNYETVALPAELRRQETGRTLHPGDLHTSARL